MADPRIGEMILYDYIRPPLLDGQYRMRVGTEVAIDGTGQALDGQDFYFDVEGPRFSLAPSEVAGVFPPRNGHGPFDSVIPHVALGRRTLPWERSLAAAYAVGPDQTPYPFLALALFEQSECQIVHNVPLTEVVPHDVFVRLGQPAGIRCDAVEADAQLLRDILPMPQELQLLTHVRQVNVDDRDLSAGDSDGFFAVVMGNRIPRDGASYVCCLVSVEERTDLLPTTDDSGAGIFGDVLTAEISDVGALSPKALGTSITAAEADKVHSAAAGGRTAAAKPSGGAGMFAGLAAADGPSTISAVGMAAVTDQTVAEDPGALAALHRQRIVAAGAFLHPTARLVLLHSWTFAVEGDGTFRQLMQGLDVGMIGDVDPAAKLDVADTGHIRIDVIDRLGAPEQSWYRGPFVPQPVSRDPLGPYHSADQARRVVAETGAENISYAAAFEAGRLLAAADARLAQDLMRWRRTAFRGGARQAGIDLLRAAMRLTAVTDPLDPVALRYSVDVLGKITRGISPPTDPYLIQAVLDSPLLQPDVVAKAFKLASVADAVHLLGADVALTTGVTVPQGQVTPTATLDEVLADTVGLSGLASTRSRAIGNVTTGGTQ